MSEWFLWSWGCEVGEIDLSLVTTEDLLEELSSRFSCMVFAGHAVTEGERDVRELREWAKDGDILKCVGLAHWLAYQLLRRDDGGAAAADE